jgi:hypothetical protein
MYHNTNTHTAVYAEKRNFRFVTISLPPVEMTPASSLRLARQHVLPQVLHCIVQAAALIADP